MTITTFLIFLSAALHLSLAIVLFLGGKEPSSRSFSVVTGLSFLWVLFRGLFHNLQQEALTLATLLNYLSFSTGIAIASVWVYFCLVFPENKKVHPAVPFWLVFTNIALVPVYLFGDLFLGPARWIEGIGHMGWEQGMFLPVYDIVFIGLWTIGFWILYTKIRHSEGIRQKQLRLVFFATLTGIAPVEFTSLILPRFFNYFGLEWLSPIIMIFWILFMGYTVIRYNQMNIRLVYTEFLVLTAVTVLFLGIFL